MVNCNGGFSDPGVIILTAVSCCHLLYFAFDKVQQNEDKIVKIKKTFNTIMCNGLVRQFAVKYLKMTFNHAN